VHPVGVWCGAVLEVEALVEQSNKYHGNQRKDSEFNILQYLFDSFLKCQVKTTTVAYANVHTTTTTTQETTTHHH